MLLFAISKLHSGKKDSVWKSYSGYFFFSVLSLSYSSIGFLFGSICWFRRQSDSLLYKSNDYAADTKIEQQKKDYRKGFVSIVEPRVRESNPRFLCIQTIPMKCYHMLWNSNLFLLAVLIKRKNFVCSFLIFFVSVKLFPSYYMDLAAMFFFSTLSCHVCFFNFLFGGKIKINKHKLPPKSKS